MVQSRSPSESDRQGFNRRWFAPNLAQVYAPTDAIGVVEAWTEVACAGNISPGELQITCGRHCYENFVYRGDTKAIIDMTGLKGFGVDPNYGLYVDVGLGNWDMYRLLNNVYGKTLPAGSCYSVGLGGHITGGGYGILSKQWGLTIDLLTAVDVVLKRGPVPELVTASASQEPDLFWALRGGGGGNFGIITRYYFGDAAPASQQMFTAAYTIKWETFLQSGGAAKFDQLLDLYSEVCEGSSQGAVPSFDILHLNHAAAGDIVWASYAFDDPTTGLADSDCVAQVAGDMVEKREKLAEIVPLSDTPGRMNGHPWHGSAAAIQAPPDAAFRHYTFLEGIQNANGSGPNQFGKYKSAYMTSGFTDDMKNALYAGLQIVPDGVSEADMKDSLCQVDSYGGAINQVAPEATAIPQRNSIMKLQYQSYWDNDAVVGQDKPVQEAAHLKWTRDLYSSVYAPYGGTPDPWAPGGKPGVVDGCYFNYCDNDLGVNGTPHILKALALYFGRNLPRLYQVKARYNPEDWFHGPQSIPLSFSADDMARAVG